MSNNRRKLKMSVHMLFVGCFVLIPGALLAAETPAIDSGATAPWLQS